MAVIKVLWPVVKETMSGRLDTALRDLEASALRGRIASGMEAVVKIANKGGQATLLVEEDFHLKGSIVETSQTPIISNEVDVREVIDDTVDVVIEKVLASGGNVVFMPNGSLSDRDRIVLLLRDTKSV